MTKGDLSGWASEIVVQLAGQLAVLGSLLLAIQQRLSCCSLEAQLPLLRYELMWNDSSPVCTAGRAAGSRRLGRGYQTEGAHRCVWASVSRSGKGE